MSRFIGGRFPNGSLRAWRPKDIPPGHCGMHETNPGIVKSRLCALGGTFLEIGVGSLSISVPRSDTTRSEGRRLATQGGRFEFSLARSNPHSAWSAALTLT
ncbi:hypothetical protein FIBSPDRAFT_846940 [Athelia psychrophila]|uniref:Uncharacterized protein n=1 Tax=Athelia psychrophila TaxID=1759441 RepID=A0A166WI46_9AGAM|nr:hypothetical protein FIBSPDRAFT_846940 [Fibularhizoctonia sp. CBS 109695]